MALVRDGVEAVEASLPIHESPTDCVHRCVQKIGSVPLAPQPNLAVASLLQRNGVYYADFYDTNRTPNRRRLSLKTKSKTVAKQILQGAEDARSLGTWDPWREGLEALRSPEANQPLSLADAVERYITSKRVNASPYTVRNYRRVLGILVDETGGGTSLESVQRHQVESFITVDRLSSATLRYRLTVARAFFRWCVDEGLCFSDPTRRVVPPRKQPSLPLAVTEGELEQVCAHLHPCRLWMGPAFRFAYLTGLRASELARLRRIDIDLEKRLLSIVVQKSGRAGTLPLSTAALRVIQPLLDRREGDYLFSPTPPPTTRKTGTVVTMLGDEFRRARKAAGITRPITPHSLRHAFCTRLAEAGKSAFVIQAAARHANIQTSARYVHLAQRELLADLNEVFE